MLVNPAALLVGKGRYGAQTLLRSGAHVRPHRWTQNSLINFGLFTTSALGVFIYGFLKNPVLRGGPFAYVSSLRDFLTWIRRILLFNGVASCLSVCHDSWHKGVTASIFRQPRC